MSLSGDASPRALLHDLLLSLQHKIDQAALAQRKDYSWTRTPTDRSFEFRNDFRELAQREIYFRGSDIPTVEGVWDEPSEWDKSGTLASFSLGTEAGDVRRFHAKKAEASPGPEKPPGKPGSLRPVCLEPADPEEYYRWLVGIREAPLNFQRFRVINEQPYWVDEPVYVAVKRGPSEPKTDDELDERAGDTMLELVTRVIRALDSQDDKAIEGVLRAPLTPAPKEAKEAEATISPAEKTSKRKKGRPPQRRLIKKPDLRRYTVNSHPGLSRAMSLALKEGIDPEVIAGAMKTCAPKISQEFYRITGRLVAGLSVHMDSNLAHWNMWSHGLERVVCQYKGKPRERYRRTKQNLNSSGHLLAWDRVERLFSRYGASFQELAPEKHADLRKAEKLAMSRQNRPAGDIVINRYADQVLEEALKEAGLEAYLERGYREFFDHEYLRYKSGLAPKRSDARRLAERKAQLEADVTDLEEARRIRHAIEEWAKEQGGERGIERALGSLVERARGTDGLEKERDSLREDLDALKEEHTGLRRESQTLRAQLETLEVRAADFEQNLRETEGQLGELQSQARIDFDTIKLLESQARHLRSAFTRAADWIAPSPYFKRAAMSDDEIDRFMLDQIGRNARQVIQAEEEVSFLAATLSEVPEELRGTSDLETVAKLVREVSLLTKVKATAVEVFERIADLLKLPVLSPLLDPLRKLGETLGRKLPPVRRPLPPPPERRKGME